MRKPKAMFLCTGNSARSQMAEGLFQRVAGSRFEVCSAGTEPKAVHPLAVRAMSEIGIDISGQTSKHVGQFLGDQFSLVVTVCDKAKEACPVFPFTFKFLHWSLEDPAAVEGSENERLAAFRNTRDEIHQRIVGLLSETLR